MPPISKQKIQRALHTIHANKSAILPLSIVLNIYEADITTLYLK